MASSPLLEAALEYVRHGWAVIPISQRTKKPLVKWEGLQRSGVTEDLVRRWWTEWPKANIAVLTGAISGVAVVDVDPDRGGDWHSWNERYPTGLTASTPRGGKHFYYARVDDAVRNSVDKVEQGVDVRGRGGYALVAPSTNSKGAAYSWDGDGEPAPWPLPVDESKNGDRPAEVREAWLERLLGGVNSGERNDACARLAGYFLGKGMPRDVVEAQLIGWNKQNRPPMPDSEVRRTVESVAEAEKRKPKGLGLEDHGPYDLIEFSAYMAKYGATPLHWLVKDWLPAQTVGMVVAPPGSYKTWLLQDLAVSVASGLPFLGSFPIERPGPVLFMQQEDWHGQTAHRFALIVGRRAGLELPRMEGKHMIVQAPPELPIYLHEHRGFRFNDEEVIRAWVERIKAIKPALVILDPLYSAGSVEDFMAGTARDMFLFKSVRDQLGTTFLIAHHTRKRNKDNPGHHGTVPEREDVWGSQFLNAWIETGWQVRRREEVGTATIVRHFKVSNDAARAVLGFHIDTTVTPGQYEVEVQEQKPGEKLEQGPDLLQIIEADGPLTAQQIADRTRLHRTTVHTRLRNLLKAGAISHTGGRYAITHGLEVG